MAQNGRANATDGTPTFEECEDPARTLWRDRQESTSGTQRQRRRVAADATLKNGCSTSLARTRPDVDTAVRVLASRFASPVERVPPAHGNELIQGVATRAQPVETMSPAGSNELIRGVATRVQLRHAEWVRSLHRAVEASTDPVTKILLKPALDLDPLGTALHVARMRPREVVLLPPHIRAAIWRFQDRADALGLFELLPRLHAVQRSLPPMCGVTHPTRARRSSPLSASTTSAVSAHHGARHNSASGTSRPNSMKK